ncbi:MAG: thiamine ABC transporter substrate-binding protein [Spirochaetales bacterium]|nr:thiamine ABC transporter substrate-binding protein [Spirochaetales bacterium]
MKMHRFVLGVCITLTIAFPLFSMGTQKERPLTVYAYDSFSGDWGPGEEVVSSFEAKHGIPVRVISAGDGLEMLTKVIAEKDRPYADVVIGISDEMATKAYRADLFEPYHSPILSEIPEFLHFDPEHRLLPFDYGNFAFIIDSERIPEEDRPKSLADLTHPRFRKSLILIDPRTSSVGLGLLLWTIRIFGEEGWLDWWEAMKDQALTITDGWSSAYGLFTEGEAPIVLSYTTSPVYHYTYEGSTRYQALIFDEGHQTTIEGVGMLRSSSRKEEAKLFIDFLLGEAQLPIAMANSMYPANGNTPLSEGFAYAPKPKVSLRMASEVIEKNLDRWLHEWTEVMSR